MGTSFQLIQLTHWKRDGLKLRTPPRVHTSSFQLIQLTHWKRDVPTKHFTTSPLKGGFPTNPINALEARISSTSKSVVLYVEFPTNPINALEARLQGQSDHPHGGRFPTNPINALEAREAFFSFTVWGSCCFQLIQLTHWKRVRSGVIAHGGEYLVSN